MINTELPKELKEFQDTVHEFADKTFRPISRKYDELEHVYPEELDMLKGVTKVDRKKKGGGDKKPSKPTTDRIGANIKGVISAEEISWADPSFLISIPNSGMGNVALATVGTDEQYAKYGDKWLAMALTEPGAGSDSGAIRTTARLEGDEWILNGEKIFVSCADRCDAIVVWASVDKKVGKAGMKSFIVDRDAPGLTLEKLEKKMGLRGSDTGTFVLSDCRIPKENILGSPEVKQSTEGFKGAMKSFDSSRPMVAAMGLGVARAALELTQEVLEKNGIKPDYKQNPNHISSIEKDYCLMEAQLEATRLITWKSAWMADNRQYNTIEASMAKGKAGRQATLITQKCCELLGPMGLSTKYLAEKWFRDSKVMDIFEGTGQIQHLIVARGILELSSSELR